MKQRQHIRRVKTRYGKRRVLVNRGLVVTKRAKVVASDALFRRGQLPKSRRFGIDKVEARKLGINSGVERAKQLVRSKRIPLKDARRVAAFYQRFKNCRTDKCEGSIDLWGGREFGRRAVVYVRGR